MPTKILVLDPLTLAGKELLGCDQRLTSIGGEVDFRHTGLDDESQIAEIGPRPAMVPPLDTPEDLMDVDVIVVASDGVSSRHDHLLAFHCRNQSSSGSPIRQSSRRRRWSRHWPIWGGSMVPWQRWTRSRSSAERESPWTIASRATFSPST